MDANVSQPENTFLPLRRQSSSISPHSIFEPLLGRISAFTLHISQCERILHTHALKIFAFCDTPIQLHTRGRDNRFLTASQESVLRLVEDRIVTSPRGHLETSYILQFRAQEWVRGETEIVRQSKGSSVWEMEWGPHGHWPIFLQILCSVFKPNMSHFSWALLYTAKLNARHSSGDYTSIFTCLSGEPWFFCIFKCSFFLNNFLNNS